MLSAIVINLGGLIADAPISRSWSPVQTAIEARQWDAAGVRPHLDTMALDELHHLIGEPAIKPIYQHEQQPGRLWQPGDDRPALADEDPAVMCAMARCALDRTRGLSSTVDRLASYVHSGTCGWCHYPTEHLQAAIEWATWFRSEVVVEIIVWPGAHGHRNYVRFGPGGIRQPRWKTFAGLPAAEQHYQVEQVLRAAAAQQVPA